MRQCKCPNRIQSSRWRSRWSLRTCCSRCTFVSFVSFVSFCTGCTHRSLWTDVAFISLVTLRTGCTHRSLWTDAAAAFALALAKRADCSDCVVFMLTSAASRLTSSTMASNRFSASGRTSFSVTVPRKSFRVPATESSHTSMSPADDGG